MMINAHVSVIRLFLEDGRINPAADNNSALGRAKYHQNKPVFDLLHAHELVQQEGRRSGMLMF